MLAGGVQWNRPFAAIDARGIIRLTKDAGYVRALVIPDGLLPPGVRAGDFAVELRLDAVSTRIHSNSMTHALTSRDSQPTLWTMRSGRRNSASSSPSTSMTPMTTSSCCLAPHAI